MKKAMVTGIASLMTVGAIVGFSLRNANDDDNTKESEGIVLTASTTESETLQATTTTTQVVKPAQETEVEFPTIDKPKNIDGFSYVVDKEGIMTLSAVATTQKDSSLLLYHEFKNGEMYLVPTNMKLVDGAGKEGNNLIFGNIQSSADNVDLTQKNFTIWYEFANDPEIGILRVDITLP